MLHVLPHPGGGGEAYVDLLEGMEGYRMERLFLAPERRPRPAVARGLLAVVRATRHVDLMHVHGEAAAALCFPILAARPSIVTLHGLHLLRRLRGSRRWAAQRSVGLVVRAAAHTICVSESERQQLALAVGGIAARRAVVIRNGVVLPPLPSAEERSAARTELDVSEGEVVGVWVGSLDAHKDPLTAVRAADRAGVTLLVVGEGPLAKTVRAGATTTVRLLGHRSDVAHVLMAGDFFVLSSMREGLSLALLEALAAGLPAVVSDLPENLEAVGDTGLAVAVGDVAGFVRAMGRLAEDEDLRRRLGEAARRRVSELFRADVMADRTRSLYDDVLAGRRSGR